MRWILMRTAILTVAVFAPWAGPVLAQNFPTRPVTLIVPWGAGGSTDATLRALAAATEKHLGQSIVIENRPGANATLGPAQMAATAPPDGYTISQIALGVFRTPFQRKTAYDPRTDFTYIIGVSGYTVGVVVRSDAPWKTFHDLLDYAKTNPGKINYATGTSGNSAPQFVMEKIGKPWTIRWTHVPFKGESEAINALLGGHIDAIASGSGWGPQVDTGKFRLLVTWGPVRTKKWPDVPVLKEIGIDLVANFPYGLAGPKGMDPKVVKTLHDAFKKGMSEPSFLAILEKLDQEVWYKSSEDYHDYAMREIVEQKRIVDDLGLKQD